MPPTVDPVEWARKMKEAKDRAARIKAERAAGASSTPPRGYASQAPFHPGPEIARPQTSSSANGSASAYGGSASAYFGGGESNSAIGGGKNVGSSSAYGSIGGGSSTIGSSTGVYGGGFGSLGGGGGRRRGYPDPGGAPPPATVAASFAASAPDVVQLPRSRTATVEPEHVAPRPEYRGMMRFGRSEEVGMAPHSVPEPSASAQMPYGGSSGGGFGSGGGDDGGYGGGSFGAPPPPRLTARAVGGRAAAAAAGGRRPAWNSDLSMPSATGTFSEPSVASSGGGGGSHDDNVSDFGGSATAARLARMRAALKHGTDVSNEAADTGGWGAPAPAAASSRLPPYGGGRRDAPAVDAAPSWDDVPVGGGSLGGGGGGGSLSRGGFRGGTRGGGSFEDELGGGGVGLSAMAPPLTGRLSLLKAKLRTGSASSASRGSPDGGSGGGSGFDARDDTFAAAPASSEANAPLHRARPATARQVASAEGPPASPVRPPTARAPPARVRMPASSADDDRPAVAALSGRAGGRGPAFAEASGRGGALCECSSCGRSFSEVALEKHESKRPVFDSKAKAVPEEAKAVAGGGRGRPKPRAAASGASAGGGGGGGGWEAKSSQLREAMRAAREYNAAVKSGGPLPPIAASAPDPSLVPCPSCGRSFSAVAAERHIPQCANIKARPTALHRGTGVAAGAGGVAKMAAAATARRPYTGY